MAETLVVAVDGPAGAGKSAVGRRVAERLGLPFVDSGGYYRAVAWLALEQGVGSGDTEGLVAIARRPGLRVEGDRVFDGERELTSMLHRPEINRNLSAVAGVGAVRDAVNDRQRRVGPPGVVMAGRDIGTVVFPDAAFKFFLTASLEERVRRRQGQKERRGEEAGEGEMRAEIAERDAADAGREVAPLRPAADALVVETDGLSVDQVVELLVRRVRP